MQPAYSGWMVAQGDLKSVMQLRYAHQLGSIGGSIESCGTQGVGGSLMQCLETALD